MAEYYVEVPVTAKMMGTVEAASEKEAIERFINTSWRCGDIEIHKDEPHTQWMEWEEIELHEQVNRGNCVYGPIGEAHAEVET